jgi:oligoribonuclease NrnB/cAMP/cGMP phosphodiesterase (DHH superfamily)
MKPLVIYHANCTDGFGAAFAAWMKFGDDAEYLPMNHGGDWRKLVPEDMELGSIVHGREVYILDFSFPKAVMEYVMDAAAETIWLDHHKTAFESINIEYTPTARFDAHSSNVFVTLDNNKSGALLAWEYFHPGTEVPMLIQHIDDRDRWQFKLKGSKEMHAALQARLPWSFKQWAEMMDAGIYSLFDEGAAILRAQEIMVEQQAKQAMTCGIKTVRMLGDDDDGHLYIGLALNTQNHISETGHVLANKSGTYGLLWYVGADGKVKCSLRSNGDYDVSAIAKAFGGGGHKNAAGFETDLDTLKGWLA